MPKHRGLESCVQMYDIPKPFSGLEIVGKEIQVVNRQQSTAKHAAHELQSAVQSKPVQSTDSIGNPNN